MSPDGRRLGAACDCPRPAYAVWVELIEVVFTVPSQEDGERLAERLSGDDFVCRVIPGDGSRTVWQVRASARDPRHFADSDEEGLHNFVDEQIRPLEEEFPATLAGGTLRYANGAAGGFAVTRLHPKKPTDDRI
jgi:hypothetical protein